MSSRVLAAMLTPVVLLLVTASAIGQAPPSQARGAKWDLPRTPWGDPDIQGVWNNVTGTPLERPAQLKDKALLTKEEAATSSKGEKRNPSRSNPSGSAPATRQASGSRPTTRFRRTAHR